MRKTLSKIFTLIFLVGVAQTLAGCVIEDDHYYHHHHYWHDDDDGWRHHRD